MGRRVQTGSVRWMSRGQKRREKATRAHDYVQATLLDE